ncbi:hypothetical protein IKG06_02020 [Candidatus Saccharibacteria bacterium]|nr:hypothetical protein [Candidatus Saccharibacteria bacterium]
MYGILKIVAEESNECVKTAILGSGGCYSGGIWGILGIAIDVLTVGIGAAAVIGVIISGIQYMTASGEPAAIAKAKNRLIQIAIGVLVYGTFYGLMRWLVPGWG